MADEPQISILDARLAEIDRRLRTIQTGLADDVGAEPALGDGLPPRIAVPEPSGLSAGATRPVVLAPAAPALAPVRDPEPETPEPETPQPETPEESPGLLIAELRGLVSDHARLLDAMGAVLASGERLLARADVSAPAGDDAPSEVTCAPAGAEGPSQLTVVSGPFSSLQAVREFERLLEALPNVASVQARGYEGGDRAVLDVHLSRPNP